jgi:hypothetical protein
MEKKIEKINYFLNDLKIIFENKKFIHLEKDYIKNLILKLKNKFLQKNLFKLDSIGCGGHFSFIYNKSLNFILFFLFKKKKIKKRIIIFFWKKQF